MAERLDNPFVVGRYVGGEYFCDREEETQLLIKQIRNGRDVALMSPRRLGKSGLIHNMFDQPEVKERYNTFFIDIFSCTCLKEMIFLLGKAIYQQLKPKKEMWKDRFFQVISSFRAGIQIDPISGLPSFELGLGDITSPETTLDEIFRYLSQSERPCIVAVDEFQQILKFQEKNVEGILRTRIQNCPNVHWIFAGSQRHLLQGMFFGPSRPFYQSVISLTLQPIPIALYREFAVGLFDKYGKRIFPTIVEETYRRYEGLTWYVQMVMNEIFDISGREISDPKIIDTAVGNILQMQADNYRNQLSLLSPAQKTVLQAIARSGEVAEPTSAEFVGRFSLGSPSTVQSALRRLLSIDTVTRTDTGYRLTDPFFAQWLRLNY